MRALEHEALGQRAEVYIVEGVPHAQGGNHVLPANALGNPRLHLSLVHKFSVKRVALVKLQPLELFVKALWVIEIKRPSNPRSVN